MKVNLISRDNFPSSIISIFEVLGNNGFQVYVVGGAVRDLLMGRTPHEFDLASNAVPDEIVELFDRTTDIGKLFGTIMVHYDEQAVEITTFRKESNYEDSRHPSSVEFSQLIHDDLKRRDFTVNAMAYNPITEEFIDLFNGTKHLESRVLFCVGDPHERFREDTLRPFRLFRFVAQFGMTVDESILLVLPELLDGIALPSMERIRHEMDRLLMGDYWLDALTLMAESGWLSLLGLSLPSQSLGNSSNLLMCRWAWLLSDVSCAETAQQFCFSKKDIRYISDLIKWDFDASKLEITAHDLAISSQALIERGYEGVALGKIQLELLDKVRCGDIMNTTDEIFAWLDNISE